jgi:hypothetical protein
VLHTILMQINRAIKPLVLLTHLFFNKNLEELNGCIECLLTFYFRKVTNRMTFIHFQVIFENIDCTYLQLQCNSENRDILWLNCETSAKYSSTLQVDLWAWCLTDLITHKLKDGLIEILVPNLHLSLLCLHCVGQLRLHLQQLSQCFVPFRKTEWLQ